MSKLGEMYAGLTRNAYKPVEEAAAKVGTPNRRSAVFAQPKEMAVYHEMRVDLLAADVERWSQRPVMRWVNSQYQQHRNLSGGATYRPAA